MHPRFDPPNAPPPESPDAILTRLRARLSAPSPPADAYAEAARYLAFRGTGWQGHHRESVVELLQAHAAAAISAVLAKVSAFPRDDVRVAAADALDVLATTPEGVAVLARHYAADRTPAVQDVLSLCLGRATGAAIPPAREALLAGAASTDEDRRECALGSLEALRLREGLAQRTVSTRLAVSPTHAEVRVAVQMDAPLRMVSINGRLAGDDTPGNTTPRTKPDTSTVAAPPRAPLDAATITAALAEHPTRSAAAAALGVDTSYLRRLARRLGVAWPEPAHAPGTAGGAWSEANRREAAREWMRRRRATRAARKGAAEGEGGAEGLEGVDRG